MVGGVLASHTLRAIARAVSRVRHVGRRGAIGVIVAGPVWVALLATSLAPGCSVAGLDVGGGGGILPGGGGDDNPGIGPFDGNACQPGDVRPFLAMAYPPPTNARQDGCSPDQITAFYAACLTSG